MAPSTSQSTTSRISSRGNSLLFRSIRRRQRKRRKAPSSSFDNDGMMQARHLETPLAPIQHNPNRDAGTQHEMKVFTVAEQQHLIQLARKGLEGRVKALERELESIKRERDLLLGEKASVKRKLADDLVLTISSSSQPGAELSNSRSLPSIVSSLALTAMRSVVPTLKRIIAPLPRRANVTTTVDPPSLAARIAPPGTTVDPPVAHLDPPFSLLDTPASEATSAPPDLIRQLSVLRVATSDPLTTPKQILDCLASTFSEPLSRPLAISTNDSGNIYVGYRAEKLVATAVRRFKHQEDTPSFQYQHRPRGSWQFSWEDLADEVRECWSTNRRLPDPHPTVGATLSPTLQNDTPNPRNGGGEPATKKKKRKAQSSVPNLADRIQPRQPEQPDVTFRTPSLKYPTINFAAPSMPPSALPNSALPASLPARPIAPLGILPTEEAAAKPSPDKHHSQTLEAPSSEDAKKLQTGQ
ncbi:hypothetical protein JCM11491_002592 [Sporobolomyces phaffii]